MNSKKILGWLERNVQWFAIALGLAFLGYMTWTYVVSAPVVLTLPGSEPLGPGEVDPYIDGKVAAPLRSMINSSQKWPMTMSSIASGVETKLRGDDIQPGNFIFASHWIDSTATDVRLPSDDMDRTGQAVGPLVTELPIVPEAQIVNVQSGRSSVIPASVAQAGQQPPTGQVKTQDCIWAAVKYSIPVKDLAAAFAAAQIQPAIGKTTILRVRLYRQELLNAADSTWGTETEIKPLSNVKLNAWPGEDNVLAETTYFNWAKEQPGRDVILQPPFYQVVAGDVPWQVAPPPPPEPPKPKIDEKPRPQPRPTRPPPARGPGGGGGRLAEDPERDANGSGNYFAPPQNAPDRSDRFYQPFDNNRPGPQSPNKPPQNGPTPPVTPPPSTPNAPPQVEAAPALPQNDFVPAQLSADIIGWAYDESVVPGHMYRYRVVYEIKNPIFQTNHIAKDPNLAKQFALSSAKVDAAKFVWTRKIDVPALTRFFLADNVSGSTDRAVHIWVVKWQDGKEKRHLFDDVMPGDYVGRKSADGDFVTGYVLVDVQPEENNRGAYILTMDDRGNLVRNEWKVDQALAVRRTTE